MKHHVNIAWECVSEVLSNIYYASATKYLQKENTEIQWENPQYYYYQFLFEYFILRQRTVSVRSV